MNTKHAACRRFAAGLLLLLLMAVSGGCAGLWAQIGYWSGGAMVPAAYPRLDNQRVAVVCVTDTSSYASGTEPEVLARSVGTLLEENVHNIDVVRWQEVADWIDKNGWDELDYREVGKGVDADQVVAIDLEGFQLHEGSTLYRGRANVTVTVYDIANGGKEVYRNELPEITFPVNSPHPVADTSEAKFRREFLRVLSRQVAKQFYRYDIVEDYATDPSGLD